MKGKRAKNKKRKTILLFDYDGTIIDSVDIAYKVFKSIAKDYGLASPKTIKHFVELYKINFYESLIIKGLLRAQLPFFIKEFRAPFLEHEKKMRVFRGIKEVITKLSKKAKIIVVTSNLSDVIKSSIKSHRIKGISAIIGSDNYIGKVEVIRKIKRKYPKCEIFYIGDTKGDMLEARKAGVKSVGVTWGYHTKKELEEAKPDFIIDKPNQLLNIFI